MRLLPAPESGEACVSCFRIFCRIFSAAVIVTHVTKVCFSLLFYCRILRPTLPSNQTSTSGSPLTGRSACRCVCVYVCTSHLNSCNVMCLSLALTGMETSKLATYCCQQGDSWTATCSAAVGPKRMLAYKPGCSTAVCHGRPRLQILAWLIP